MVSHRLVILVFLFSRYPHADPAMWKLINIFLQYVIPHHLLSRLMYRATRCSWRPWKNALIRLFIQKYNVDMRLAEKSSAHEFETFNDFFTRSLKPGIRPLASVSDGLVSPVDAAISALGAIEDNRIFQAKGKKYSLEELLNGANEYIGRYRNGNFITLYLSPRDYHRIHIPADGELLNMTYIPGRLFSVNPATTDRIDNLFARNERVVHYLQLSNRYVFSDIHRRNFRRFHGNGMAWAGHPRC